MCPWRRLLPGHDTRFFLQRGCCCQGKKVVPVNHFRGEGLSSHLACGSKIRLTAGFELCLQGLGPSSLAAAHSPFQCVPCFAIVHSMPVLAASHSSLAQRNHILRRTLLPRLWLSGITFFEGPSFLGLLTICISPLNRVRWCCRGRGKCENNLFQSICSFFFL